MKKTYFRSILYLAYFGLLLLCGGCEMIDYSPHQVQLYDDEKALNAKYARQVEALNIKPGDTLRVALIADTQRFYDETKKAVKAINAMNAKRKSRIHFVMHGGDYTDFGLMEEFRWIHNILKELDMPYLTVIGNHDCVANGKKIYQAMFGPYEFTVNIGRNRFIFMNTNSLEFEESIIRLDYLENNLKDKANYDNAFVISHVAPFDNDFEDAKELPYAQLMKDYNVRYSIHGHNHGYQFQQLYGDPFHRYLTIGSTEKNTFVLLTVVGTKVSHEVIPF